MDRLSDLENQSIYLIREAYHYFPRMALLWSIGKDSTTLLWLCRKAFFGTIPFPVIHIDTTYKFPEMYVFRDRYAKEWKMRLIVEKNDEALKRGIGYATHDAFTVCTELKTNALKAVIRKRRLQAVLVGIRRDEHGVRAKERHFSLRTADFTWEYENQSPELWKHGITAASEMDHVRIHPLLEWAELDVWRYIRREQIPVCSLYFASGGKRYRSLGCMPITKPVKSAAVTVEEVIEELRTTRVAERSGRAQDKESAHMMQKLRALGYL